MDSAPFLDQLQKELGLWQSQGFIGESQARRIRAHYGLALGETAEEQRRGRVATVFGVLGALLVGAGVILFVASNWQGIERPQKILLLQVALVAAYGLGYWLKYSRRASPRIGAAFVFLGSLIFGANIFLVAQIYHVPVGEPLLLAFWAVGTFPIAYAAASRPSLYLAILAAVAWYGFQLNTWFISEMGTAGVVGIAAFLPYGLLIFSLGEIQRSFRNARYYSAAFVQLGLVVSFCVLWLFSFKDFWYSLVRGLTGLGRQVVDPTPVNVSFTVFMALALIITLAAMWRQRLYRVSSIQGIGVLALAASSLIAVFHPFTDPTQYAIFFNVAMLGGILWAMMVGIWTQRESPINIGLVFFVLLLLARYFDYAFTLMDRSLAFVVAGLLLLGAGYLMERFRRRVIQQMSQEVAS